MGNPKPNPLFAYGGGPLDPIGRFSEILFGLIMVLTFTCAISVAEGSRATVGTLLIAALGCNLAWGIVDGVMYWIVQMVERGRNRAIGRVLRSGINKESARDILQEVLPEEVHRFMGEEDFDRLFMKVSQSSPLPKSHVITKEDLKGSFWVFLYVFLTTFPVALPFIFVSELRLAMRLSNGVAIALLFILGWKLGRYSDQSAVSMGLVMVAIGVVLVAITIALGG